MVATLSSSSSTRQAGELYLRLQLAKNFQAALPIAVAQEALTASDQDFTPLPNQPAWILGLFSYRNSIRWGLDLAQMLDLDPLAPVQGGYHLVVMRPEASGVGLAVQQVRGVVSLALHEIQPLPPEAGSQPAALSSCCRGIVWQGQGDLWVLDPSAVAQQLSTVFYQQNSQL